MLYCLVELTAVSAVACSARRQGKLTTPLMQGQEPAYKRDKGEGVFADDDADDGDEFGSFVADTESMRCRAPRWVEVSSGSDDGLL